MFLSMNTPADAKGGWTRFADMSQPTAKRLDVIWMGIGHDSRVPGSMRGSIVVGRTTVIHTMRHDKGMVNGAETGDMQQKQVVFRTCSTLYQGMLG